ncbi:MAG: hypothetical protein FWC91_04870 [Defluviitaleaceae bacterium]|nr:hypothetical protein [Defluviitaleaceae bacterium]
MHLLKSRQFNLEGSISFEPAGNNGFGYDPIFFIPKLGCTLAQLSREEKICISHRSQALKNMLNLLVSAI